MRNSVVVAATSWLTPAMAALKISKNSAQQAVQGLDLRCIEILESGLIDAACHRTQLLYNVLAVRSDVDIGDACIGGSSGKCHESTLFQPLHDPCHGGEPADCVIGYLADAAGTVLV